MTGGAGTGKSFLLKYLKDKYGIALHLTASTGIAAVNIGGQTFHSWANLHLGQDPVEIILKKINRNPKRKQILETAQMLAIDEISMIKGDLLDKFDLVMQKLRKNRLPFGGLQVLLFGDFLQLPPIKDNLFEEKEEKLFVFESDVWRVSGFETFLLTEIFRQKEEKFVNLLNRIRFGNFIDNDLELLKSRENVVDYDKFEPTIITTHNYQADQINNKKLKEINEISRVFERKEFGDEKKLEVLRRNCLAPETLELKIGAQVMMLKNYWQDSGIVNGSTGIVVDFSEDGIPVVEFYNGRTYEIKSEDWTVEIFNPETNEMEFVAGMTQIPLRLAWAITVHKSQGMTLDKIKCQLGRAFSEGQIYVALSRAKTLGGVFLDYFDASKIKVNPKVLEFYEELEK